MTRSINFPRPLSQKMQAHFTMHGMHLNERRPNSTKTKPLINMSQMVMGPEDALQKDIVTFDDLSGGYNAVITAIAVLSRYLFAYNIVGRGNENCGPSHHQTQLLPNNHINRQRIPIYSISDRINQQNFGHQVDTRHHQTCPGIRHRG